MFDARSIVKLILDGEVPPEPGPPRFNAKKEIFRLLAPPRGNPVDLFQRWTAILAGRKKRRVPELVQGTGPTYLESFASAIALTYYGTDLIIVSSTNNVYVTTGGWKTVSTKARINWAAPGGWQIFAKVPSGEHNANLVFFWWHPGKPYSRTLPFTDSDRILADGTLALQAAPTHVKPSLDM